MSQLHTANELDAVDLNTSGTHASREGEVMEQFAADAAAAAAVVGSVALEMLMILAPTASGRTNHVAIQLLQVHCV